MMIKLVPLMEVLGYVKSPRAQATLHLKKLVDIDPKFEDAKVRKSTQLLTQGEAIELLEKMKGIKSNKAVQEKAQAILDCGFDANLLTDDVNWSIAPKKRIQKPRIVDFNNYLAEQGLSEDFKAWFDRMNRQGLE